MPRQVPEEEIKLLSNIQDSMPALQRLLEEYSDHWGYEDPIYRFYHQSFKVYGLQNSTQKIVEVLQALALDLPLNEWFMEIVRDGTGRSSRKSTIRIGPL